MLLYSVIHRRRKWEGEKCEDLTIFLITSTSQSKAGMSQVGMLFVAAL
jgi:hypothetical protein